MAGFELDPNMPLGHTGKLELLYNRALQRSKVPDISRYGVLIFLEGLSLWKHFSECRHLGLMSKGQQRLWVLSKGFQHIKRFEVFQGILKGFVRLPYLKRCALCGLSNFSGDIPRFNAMNLGDPRG